MHHVLVVKEAYGDLRRGDTVTDPDEVKRLHAEAGNHFVRVQHHGIHPDAEAKAAQAKAAKSKVATTEKDA